MHLFLSKQVFFTLISFTIALLFYFFHPLDISNGEARLISIAILMIALWVSEALPMPVVALLPLILFPVLGIADMERTASSYSNKVIFLFLGGFMLALAIEKWNLHRRIALNIIRHTGTSGDRIILGFIIATGVISMWLSNTATTMMMFPIALSVVKVITDHHPQREGIPNFSTALMIAIALSSNFGGISTIIGTPPNVAYVGYINKTQEAPVEFVNWMMVSMPVALILLIALYLVMVKWLYPNRMRSDENTRDFIENEVRQLGKISITEKRVLFIFIMTAALWIMREPLNKLLGTRIDDNMIALAGGLLLFIVPSGREKNQALLDWIDTRKMAWGILLLFGGGIALATAFEDAGLIEKLGTWFAQFKASNFMVILLVTFIAIFLSELMSNVAQVIVFAPVVTGLAHAMNMHPFALGIPMTLAASCASMLPMGTPPNAIAFSSGYIRLSQMMKVGFVMNLIAVALITLFSWLLLPLVFGIK